MKSFALIILIFTSAVLSNRFLEENNQKGGIHDYIFRLPRETLIKWALTTERFHRKVNNIEGLIGGLTDYVFDLTNKQIVSKILKETDEHPEIANQEKLESLSIEYGLSSIKEPLKVQSTNIGGDGGIHDYIWRLPREKLISWAITSETYHREVNHQHLVGGLEDYVNSLKNEDIINYILAQVKEHPELAKKGKLDSLSENYNIDVNSFHIPEKPVTSSIIGGDGGFHDFIWRTERPVLNNWAIACERYHIKVNNLQLIGGLHDYINNLSNQQVIEYILNKVKEHPELANAQKLNSLVTEIGISDTTGLKSNIAPKSTIIGGDGGLHDYIWKSDRLVLNKWALTSEKYHRKVNNLNILGGLNDYIDALTNQQVIEYIIKEIKEHPEIASSQKLDSLSVELGLAVKPLTLVGDGGLHDYIWRVPRTTLDSWALATERYHNNENQIIGGLHDFIGSLSNQQVIDYIMTKVKEHPELNSNKKLDSLVAKFEPKKETPSLLAAKPILGSGLHDIIISLDRNTLISYALAMDKYSHDKSPRIGGINDYVNKLEDSEIRNFILMQADSYPELNNKVTVEGLIKNYNITSKQN